MLDFLGDIGISPLGLVALPALLISYLNFVSCLFLIIFFFQCVRFSGLYWLFPPQAWLPCRPFWSLVWVCVLYLVYFSSYLFFNVLDFLGYIGISPPQPGCPVGPFDLLFERLQVGFFWRTRVSSPGKIEYLQPNTKIQKCTSKQIHFYLCERLQVDFSWQKRSLLTWKDWIYSSVWQLRHI